MQCPRIPDETVPPAAAATTIPAPPPEGMLVSDTIPPSPSMADWSGFASDALDEEESAA